MAWAWFSIVEHCKLYHENQRSWSALHSLDRCEPWSIYRWSA
jgi:hypothetical protein